MNRTTRRNDYYSEQSLLPQWIEKMNELGRYLSVLPSADHVLLDLARQILLPGISRHSERVAAYAGQMGLAAGLSDVDILLLTKAALLHDIGKAAIPSVLLQKKEMLTSAEYNTIKLHPLIGARLCAHIPALKAVADIIQIHHERFDGSGYPMGLSGKDIPLTARILGMVDCYDALTSERPYKKALSKAQALKIMADETQRGLWDPFLFELFTVIVRQDIRHGQLRPEDMKMFKN